EPRVHETGDELAVPGVLVVLHALDERRSAVADADDRDPNGSHRLLLSDVTSRTRLAESTSRASVAHRSARGARLRTKSGPVVRRGGVGRAGSGSASRLP